MENCPTITLRRGKIEINVENAAAIIKKIDEMYPAEKACRWPSNINKIKRELSDAERERQKVWMLSARDWFKKEIFGGSEDFEVVVNAPSTSEPSDSPVNGIWEIGSEIQVTTTPLPPSSGTTPPTVNNSATFPLPTPSEQPVIKSVNKNAYEIRTDILAMAIDFVRYKTGLSGRNAVTENDVLSTANQFYKFVENRR